MDDLIKKLEKLTGVIDYCYQEGVKVKKKDVVSLRNLINQLDGICNDLEDDNLQSYFNQVQE